MGMAFDSNGQLTLGVELEIQLLNPKTLDLTPKAPQMLEQLKSNHQIKPEVFQSMLEINTGICSDVHEVAKDMRATMDILQQVASEHDILLASTGTHPFARYTDRKPYPSERNFSVIDRNQWVARRLMIFGLHVHIGMRDGDSCIQYNNFFLHFIPHFLALTASSPFWQRNETGLASCRPTIFESSPAAGHPYRFRDWESFSDLCSKLVKSKAIESHKDLWWDMRPSPGFGTLEIRACDGTATLEETLGIVAFIHALALWFSEHTDYTDCLEAPYMWMMRENKWRAMRYGLEAEIIADEGANLIPLRKDIDLWLERLKPIIEKMGYQPYIGHIGNILQHGSSAERQVKIFGKNKSFEDVTLHNAQEFSLRAPLY